MRRPIRTECSRNGFTLLEATITSALMAFLTLLLSQAWWGLGRPLTDAAARFRLTQEASLTVASFARDFSGSLVGTTDTQATAGKGSDAPANAVGRLVVDRSQLWLCFDGGDDLNGIADWASPDTVITYHVESDQLIRWNQNSGTSFVVARHVDELDVRELGNGIEIGLTFKYRKFIRTYTIIARDP